MLNKIVKTAFAVTVCAAALSFAGDQEEFCAGFEMGYKTVKGNNVIVPICPIPPITPIGSTPYQEGLKAGMKAARSR